MENLNLGINPLYSFLAFLILALPVFSWLALYARGAEARDLLFWGAISVVIPILGPVAAIIYAFRLTSDKTKPSAALRS